jgi:hypothetical protein
MPFHLLNKTILLNFLNYNITLDSCDRNGKGQQNLWEGRIKFEYFCNEVAWIKYFCNIKRIKEA